MTQNNGFNKDFPLHTAFLRPSDGFMRTRLQESKTKLGFLVVCKMLVCPLLCAVVLVSLWTESKHERRTFIHDISILLNYVNSYLTGIFITLWFINHIMEIFLLEAIARDSLKFCRMYATTVAPLLWTLTLMSFSLVLWSGLNPLDSNNMTKFIIVLGLSTIFVANFLSYHLKALSEYTNYLSITAMINERSALIEFL